MSSPPDSDGNHRVTNAILATKLDNLIEDVRKMCERMDRRMAFLEEKVDIRCGEVEGQSRHNAENIARLEERQKATTGILGALTVLLSTAAGFVGSVFK